jgi:hypothetical protein
MSKCPYCEVSCGNSWCSYVNSLVLEVGKTYTNNLTDLSIKILSIHEETSDCYVVLGKLTNKKNHIYYETKEFTIAKENIKNWKVVE